MTDVLETQARSLLSTLKYVGLTPGASRGPAGASPASSHHPADAWLFKATHASPSAFRVPLSASSVSEDPLARSVAGRLRASAVGPAGASPGVPSLSASMVRAVPPRPPPTSAASTASFTSHGNNSPSAFAASRGALADPNDVARADAAARAATAKAYRDAQRAAAREFAERKSARLELEASQRQAAARRAPPPAVVRGAGGELIVIERDPPARDPPKSRAAAFAARTLPPPPLPPASLHSSSAGKFMTAEALGSSASVSVPAVEPPAMHDVAIAELRAQVTALHEQMARMMAGAVGGGGGGTAAHATPSTAPPASQPSAILTSHDTYMATVVRTMVDIEPKDAGAIAGEGGPTLALAPPPLAPTIVDVAAAITASEGVSKTAVTVAGGADAASTSAPAAPIVSFERPLPAATANAEAPNVRQRLDFSGESPSTPDGIALLLELGVDVGGGFDGLDILAGPLRAAIFDPKDPYSLEAAFAARVGRAGRAPTVIDDFDSGSAVSAAMVPPLSLSLDTARDAEVAAAEQLAAVAARREAELASEAIRAEARAAVAEAESTPVSWALREIEPLRPSPDELYRALMDSVDALSSAEEGASALTALQATQAEASAQRQSLALAMQWSAQSEAASVAAHFADLHETAARDLAAATVAAQADMEDVFSAQAAAQGAVVADLARQLSAAQFRADRGGGGGGTTTQPLGHAPPSARGDDDDSYGSASFNEYSDEFDAESIVPPSSAKDVPARRAAADGEVSEDEGLAVEGETTVQMGVSTDSAVPEDEELGTTLNLVGAAGAPRRPAGRAAASSSATAKDALRARSAPLPRESELDAILEDAGLSTSAGLDAVRATGDRESLETLLANFRESVGARLRADHDILETREAALRATTIAEINVLDAQRAALEGGAGNSVRAKIDAVTSVRQRVVMRFHIALADIERTRAEQRSRHYKDIRDFQRQVYRLTRSARADTSASERVASLDRSLGRDGGASSTDSSCADVTQDASHVTSTAADAAIAGLRAPITTSGPDTLKVLELMLRTVLSSVLTPMQPLDDAAKRILLVNSQQQAALAPAPVPLEPHVAAGRASLDVPPRLAVTPVPAAALLAQTTESDTGAAASTSSPRSPVNRLATSQSSVSSDYSEDFDDAAVAASPRSADSPTNVAAARAVSARSPTPEEIPDEVDVDKLLADLENSGDGGERVAPAVATPTEALPATPALTSAFASVGKLTSGGIGADDTFDIVIPISKGSDAAAQAQADTLRTLVPHTLPSGDTWMMNRDDVVSAVTDKLADTLVDGLTNDVIAAQADEPNVGHSTDASVVDDDDLYAFKNTANIVSVAPPSAAFVAKPAAASREPSAGISPALLSQTPAQAWSEDATSYLNEVFAAARASDELRAAVLQLLPQGADGASGGTVALPHSEALRVHLHLPTDLFIELERARERDGRGPKDHAEIEALQIQHKLIFDVINENLARIDDRHKHRILAVRAANTAGFITEANELVARLIDTVCEELRGTLLDVARNVDAPAARTGSTALSARAAALARADVTNGVIGGDELSSRQEFDYIVSLIADSLAAELTEDAIAAVAETVEADAAADE